ncbi:MAG: aldo/keto reductase [Methanobacteriaceae archaeon]
MQYRKLGTTGEEVSVLGFGAMRFPTINGKNSQINEKEALEMLNYAYDNGINYFDTAYPYHGEGINDGGASEPFIGEFLNTITREKVNLATKLPSWLIEKREDMDFYLDQQLKRLGTDKIDFYLLHSIKEKYWRNLEKLDVLEFLDSAKSDGKVKYVGFSHHDTFDLLLEVMDSYDFDIVQTQLNYVDEGYQSGINGLRYIDSMDIGTVIMEPLRGGNLVNNFPSDVQKIWDNTTVDKTPVDLALSYLWDMGEVDLVLSGMSSLEQVKENIEIANKSEPNSLNDDEKNLIADLSSAYYHRIKNRCSDCGYCMPCPQGVNIPKCIENYNNAVMLDNPEASFMSYFAFLDDGERADSCNECGNCEFTCPQMIDIPKVLKKVKETFPNQ